MKETLIIFAIALISIYIIKIIFDFVSNYLNIVESISMTEDKFKEISEELLHLTIDAKQCDRVFYWKYENNKLIYKIYWI